VAKDLGVMVSQEEHTHSEKSLGQPSKIREDDADFLEGLGSRP